jgi:hypothetical protein
MLFIYNYGIIGKNKFGDFHMTKETASSTNTFKKIEKSDFE